jgi:2-polyprenyl-3-methyl-5-hydroxy-6-metoxy-1,4-benzoquinol methylase
MEGRASNRFQTGPFDFSVLDEFGIGTGRIALPLAARGPSVAGIDNSEAMGCAPRREAGRR